MAIAVIGVPYSSTGLATGEARAPNVLRAAGLVPALQQAGAVTDRGDVDAGVPTTVRDPISRIIAPAELARTVACVREEVAHAYDAGEFPLVMGGECPLLIGCLAAARDRYRRVGILFLDGHEDAWPPEASTTGEAADMELGLALGLTAVNGLPDIAALLPLVRVEDTIVLGPRDREEIAAAGLPSIAARLTMHDDTSLHAATLPVTVTTLTRRLADEAGHWWLHLDLDVLSTEAMPAVRYPQAGGLNWDELAAIVRVALATPGLVGWDVTIYNPDLDPERRAAARIVAFLGEMAGDLADTPLPARPNP